MKRIGIISVLSCISFLCIHGQEVNDTLRIQEFLNNPKRIILNPEIQKAIESGTFLLEENSVTKMESSPLDYPFTRDFSEYFLEDSTLSRVSISSLPPSVLMRYGLDRNIKDSMYVSLVFYEEEYQLIKALSKPVPTGVGVIWAFSMEDILRHIFWASERAKKRNRKHATAWRFYNMD